MLNNKYGSIFKFLTMVLVIQLATLVLVRNLDTSSKLFEQILASTAVCFIVFLVKGLLSSKRLLTSSEYLAWLLFVSIFFCFGASVTLLNIDRSRSFYVLSWVDAGVVSGSISKPDLKNVKSLEKIDVNAISQRLSEQSQRGLISVSNNEFSLTIGGRILVTLSKSLSNLFKLNGWNLNRF